MRAGCGSASISSSPPGPGNGSTPSRGWRRGGSSWAGRSRTSSAAASCPIRKKGKLPGETYAQDYALEYGTATVEVHRDALPAGARVLLVDDLLATGGTARAGISLLERLGAEVVGCAFVVDLPDLGGRRALEAMEMQIHTLCDFDGA